MRLSLCLSILSTSWSALVVATRLGVPKAPAHSATESFKYSTGYFDQLLDHDRPELGTFKQRYFYSTEYWAGPGSPVKMQISWLVRATSLTLSLGHCLPTGRTGGRWFPRVPLQSHNQWHVCTGSRWRRNRYRA